MKLISVKVKDYKSIDDSDSVRIEEGVTALVGKNESGKSAFLEALYRVNPVPSGLRSKFNELYDYPRRRRNADQDEIPRKKPIEAWFELSNAEVQKAEQRFGQGVLKSKEIGVWQDYRTHMTININSDEHAVVRHFSTNAQIPEAEVSGVHSLSDLRNYLDRKEQRLELEEGLLTKLQDFDLFTELWEMLEPSLPKFLYFDAYSTLPGRFSIPYVQNTNASELSKEERIALSFLRLARVDSTEFLENEYEARRAALEAAAIQISDEVFEYWSQNRELEVQVDADFNSPPKEDGVRVPPYLDIRVRNNRHRITLNFSERSSGFVWFFSFLAFFSEYRNSDENLILLLDEPGYGLHGAAQEDLLRFINERLAPSHQVIYTTHSLFMIDPTQLDRVRVVEDQDNVGTKVSEEVLSVSRDTIAPLHGALGVRLSQTLFVGNDNLIVEGPSDILYLQILSSYLESQGRTGLDPRWVLVPAGGVGNIPAFVSLFHSQLNVAVLLDAKSGSSQRVDNLISRGILEQNHVFPLTQITNSSEADIEDMFEIGFYLSLLKGSGVADLKVADLPPDNCILKRLTKNFGGRFDHYRPAMYFQREQDKLLKRLNEKTLSRFEDLFERVNSTLD